jgi:hypothetical protein
MNGAKSMIGVNGDVEENVCESRSDWGGSSDVM